MMRSSRFAVLVAIIGVLSPRGIVAQTAGDDGLEAPSRFATTLRQAIESEARQYPFVGFRLFGRDSARLVFDDSSFTVSALRAGKWMFGPTVTAAEADGCPPEKVLGRKIARALWHGLGKPNDLQYITIAVHGSGGFARYTMYYHRSQLDGPWVGDPPRQ
jgi:hypothetical protein